MAEYYPTLGYDSSFSHSCHVLATVMIYFFHIDTYSHGVKFQKPSQKTNRVFCVRLKTTQTKNFLRNSQKQAICYANNVLMGQ